MININNDDRIDIVWAKKQKNDRYLGSNTRATLYANVFSAVEQQRKTIIVNNLQIGKKGGCGSVKKK